MKKILLFLTTCFTVLFTLAQKTELVTLPLMDIKTLDGKVFNTKDITNEGKPVMIVFWSTYAKPALAQLREINEVYDKWVKETGVKLFAISVDGAGTFAKVAPYVAKEGWKYVVLYDEKCDFIKALQGNGDHPFTVILNGQGKIVWQSVSYAPGYENKMYDILKSTGTKEINKKSEPNIANGVEINGVVWATCNVNTPGTFTESPSDFGMFYQWNRAVGWSSTEPMINHNNGTIWDKSIPLGGENWENKVCPQGWRIPTYKELESLIFCGSAWGNLNGVQGRYFGIGKQKVFFPAAGKRHYGDGCCPGGSWGFYWSSTDEYEYEQYHDNSNCCPWYLYFTDSVDFYHMVRGGWNRCRSQGFSIRCVKE